MDIDHLIRQLRYTLEGNSDAFEPVIEKFKDRIFTVCFRMIGNSEDAKDIAQDTFVEAFVKLRTLQEPANFPNWIYKIAVNKCLNFFRKRRKMSPFFEFDILGVEKEKADFLKNDLVNFFLSQLTLKYRTVLILFYIEEKQIKEIAEILEIGESAVKMRLSRAREKLKNIKEKK